MNSFTIYFKQKQPAELEQQIEKKTHLKLLVSGIQNVFLLCNSWSIKVISLGKEVSLGINNFNFLLTNMKKIIEIKS